MWNDKEEVNMWNDKEEVKTQDCSTCVNNNVCKYRLVFEQLLKSYKEVVEAPENNWLYMVEPVCLRRREVQPWLL